MKLAMVVYGLGYGDEGKGSVVDYLTRKHGVENVIRFNGGPQAGHNVITSDGQHHTFASFGSGTLAGANTYLSESVFVDPFALLNEADALSTLIEKNALATLTIHESCPIITPFHAAAGRIMELVRQSYKHGSVGTGFGEAVEEQLLYPQVTLRAGHLSNRTELARRLELSRRIKYDKIRPFLALNNAELDKHVRILSDHSYVDDLVDVYHWFDKRVTGSSGHAFYRKLLESKTPLIFEGAQGVLLDETYGFWPHTTWSSVLPNGGVHRFGGLGIGLHGAVSIRRYGVLRSFATRHGAGPLVTEAEIAVPPISCWRDMERFEKVTTEPHNPTLEWTGPFRRGFLDLVSLQYAAVISSLAARLSWNSALRSNGLESSDTGAVVLTHMDKVAYPWPVCTAYDTAEGRISSLVPPGSTHSSMLLRAMELAPLLSKAKPVYEPVADLEDLLNRVETACGVPVSVISAGASHLDKTELARTATHDTVGADSSS